MGNRAPVVALAATTTAGYGILYYAYGVLLVPMEDDLGWSRPFLSAALSAGLVFGALLSVPVGRWLDRHPPRPLFLAGSVLSALLVVSWASARSPAVFLVTWVLLGAGQAVLFYEPAFTVLTKRFEGRDRHRAVTTVTLAGGLASTVFGPLTAALERWLEWRGAVLVLGGLLLGVTLPACWFGLRPGRPGSTGAGDRAAVADSGRAPGEVLRSRPFLVLTVAYLLTAITTFAVPVHLVAFLRERGMGAGAAATVLGGVGLVQVLGRTTFVRLTHRRLAVHLATWVLAAKGAGVVALVVLPLWPGVVVFLAVYGAANGIGTLTRALTLADLYGPDHYGAISSALGAVTAVGGAVAPFAAAAMADVTGAGPVFLGLAALSVAAAACNEVVARPTRGVDEEVLDADPAALSPGA